MTEFSAGYQTGTVLDPDRTNWDGTGPRPISWSLWYPSETSSATEKQLIGPPGRPYFDNGLINSVGDVSKGKVAYPLILMSHGTGGSAPAMGWFGRRMAEAGYFVLGANHHGNTSLEPYRPEGFLCSWERSRDLSRLADDILVNPAFADRIDRGRIFAAGHSLGGHTVLACAGATYSNDQFLSWLGDQPDLDGPREFPDLGKHVGPLMANSQPFREAMSRHGKSYHDPRFKAVFAMAPAPTVRGFTDRSLVGVRTPVHIQTGAADQECPADTCTHWLGSKNPDFQIEILEGDVGHYVYLSLATEHAREDLPQISIDPPSVDRDTIHTHAATAAHRFFSATV